MLTVFALHINIAHAASCSSSEYDKAEYYAEKAADKIVSSYGGGQDIVVNVKKCSFNGYSEKFKLNIEIYFSGVIFKSEKYNSDGILTMNEDGSGADYSETYANQNLKDTRGAVSFFQGMLELGVLGAEVSQGNSSSGFKIDAKNNCNQSIKLAVRYKNMAGNWKTGWWGLDSGDDVYLHSDGEAIRTGSAVLYYYAEYSNDSDRHTSGDYTYSVRGRSLDMTKLVDKNGSSNIVICK